MFNFFNDLNLDENIQAVYKIKLFCETGKLSEDLPAKIRSEVLQYFGDNNFSAPLNEEERGEFTSKLYDSLYYEAIEPFEYRDKVGDALDELKRLRRKNFEEGLRDRSEESEFTELSISFSSRTDATNARRNFGEILSFIEANSEKIISISFPRVNKYYFGQILKNPSYKAFITFRADKDQRLIILNQLPLIRINASFIIREVDINGRGVSNHDGLLITAKSGLRDDLKKSIQKSGDIQKPKNIRKKIYSTTERKKNRTRTSFNKNLK